MANFTAISTRFGNYTGVFHLRGGKLPVASSYEEIVRQQIVDALVTNAKERIMRPDYGADIQSLLFDPGDTLVRDDTANAIKTRLGLLVPRATIKNVTITMDPNALAVRGITADSPGIVLIDVDYAARRVEGSLAVVMSNTGASDG